MILLILIVPATLSLTRAHMTVRGALLWCARSIPTLRELCGFLERCHCGVITVSNRIRVIQKTLVIRQSLSTNVDCKKQ